MADAPAFDPSKPFEPVSTGAAPAFDPSKPFEPVAAAVESPGAIGGMLPEAWRNTKEQAVSAWENVRDSVKPFEPKPDESFLRGYGRQVAETAGKAGKFGRGALQAAGLPLAPFIGAGESLVGRPMAHGIHKIGEWIAPDIAAKEDPEQIYQDIHHDVGTALGANAPRGGLRPVPAGAPAPTVPEAMSAELTAKLGPGAIKPGTAAAEFDIPLSTGEAAGDFSKIQFEQSALKGAYGPQAQKAAQEFFDRRRGAVDEAVEGVGTKLDRFGQDIVESPIAGAEMAGEGLNQAARVKKDAYKASYDEFADLPGVIHAAGLEGIGQKIKGRLSLRDEPVIIDDVTTPIASKAIRDIENNIDRLKIQNRADPFGEPNPENVVGVNLKGIDQTRKRLMVFSRDAQANPSDRRAMKAIIGAFDQHIEDAISGGLFSGSDRALQALKEARAGFSNYQRVFKSRKDDGGVGAVIDKIVNRADGAGATAGEVSNFIYGAAGTGASGLSTRVAQRMRDILGADSPEWAGIRQGMWQRLTQATEGKDAYGPQKMSQRIFEFVNGSGRPTAQMMFTPQELARMRRLAEALKETVPPVGTVNHSNSGYAIASIARNTVDAAAESLGHLSHIPGASWALRIGRGIFKDRQAASKTRQSLYGAQPKALPGPPLIGPGLLLGGEGGPTPQRASGGRVNASNIDANPTDAQKEAGNYAKDHVKIHGLDITIENAKGSKREGVDRDGKPWSVKMPAHYGYLKGTVGKDKDHVDVYLGPHIKAPKVFVVDQVDAESGKFDEHKCFLGFPSPKVAIDTYRKAFSDGRADERMGCVVEMPVASFRRWLTECDTTKPMGMNRARGGRANRVDRAEGGDVVEEAAPEPPPAETSPSLYDRVSGSLRAARESFVPTYDQIASTVQQARESFVDPSAGFAVEAAMNALPGAKIARPPGIRAYHGSPHSFDRFDMSKIGTGEGAQAYGHGLYFAEAEAVARDYRKQLAKINDIRGELSPKEQDVFDIISKGGNDSEALKYLAGYSQSLPEAKQIIERMRLAQGHMYEVNINAHPEQFLDWDKPLAQQAPEIGKAVSEIPNPIVRAWTENGAFPNVAGKSLYDTLAMRGNTSGMAAGNPGGRAVATDTLREAGIPGIKYLDQGSRTTSGGELIDVFKGAKGWQSKIRMNRPNGEQYFTTSAAHPTREAAEQWANSKITNPGTSNYVLFDDNLVDIMRKYGIAGAAPVAGVAAAQSKNDGMKRGGGVALTTAYRIKRQKKTAA